MRARSIKPSICDNELLGTADPLLTLLFERLWMMADREGRLEDRPLRIKAQAFPYRNDLEIDPLLKWLADNEFIARYDGPGSIKIIQVVKFSDHQRPHKNEVPSVLPAMVVTKNNQGTKRAQPRSKVLPTKDASTSLLISSSLTPSSLTPDSLNLDCLTTTACKATPAWFEDFRAAYPPRAGDQGWHKAQKAANARVAEGHTVQEFLQGARRYAAFIVATGKANTEFVQQAATFLGPGKPFLLPWTAPAEKESAMDEIRRLNGVSHERIFEAESNSAALVPFSRALRG